LYVAGIELIGTTTRFNSEIFSAFRITDGTVSTVPAVARLMNSGAGRVTKLLFTDNAIIDGIMCMVPVSASNSYFSFGFAGYTEQGLQVFSDGRVIATSNMRAPIFYDSDNTAYFCNPAGDSNFDGLSIGTGSGGNQRIRFSAGNDNSSYSALRFLFAGSELMQMHVFAPNWQGGGFPNGSAGAFNLSATNGVTFGSWPSPAAWVNNSGTFQANGDFRAPIFYDSNNTAYYLNPNGTSRLGGVDMDNGNSYGIFYAYGNGSVNGSAGIGMNVFSTGGNGAIMAFHRGGFYAVNMGLDSDNVIRIGGWSAPANRFQFDMGGNFTAAGNVTAYSDERLKKDWAILPDDFLRRLAQVKSGTYTRIDSEERQVGVSAQGLQEFLEEAVQTDAAGMLSVNYGGAALASAVELAKYVTALEQRISQLEARL
jgi:hypothetical protein